MFMKHYAPNKCEPSIEALNFNFGVGVRASARCERRGVFCVNSKKKYFFFFGGGGGGGGGGGWSG